MKKICFLAVSFLMLIFSIPGMSAADGIVMGNGDFYHPEGEKSYVEITIDWSYPNIPLLLNYAIDDIYLKWDLYLQFDEKTDDNTNYFHFPLDLELTGERSLYDVIIEQPAWKIKDDSYLLYEGNMLSFLSYDQFDSDIDENIPPTYIEAYNISELKLGSDDLGSLYFSASYLRAELVAKEINAVGKPTWARYEVVTDTGDNCGGSPCGTLIGDSDSTSPELILNGLAEIYHTLTLPYNDEGASIFEVRTGGEGWESGFTVNTEGTVDTDTDANYTITYSATGEDAAGYTIDGTVERLVHVVNAPTVVSTTPANQTTEYIDLSGAITATFSKEMNEVSVTSTGTISVEDGSGGGVDGDATYDGDTKTVIFTPESKLNYGTMYVVTISTDAEDTEGYSLPEEYRWSFTIQSQTDITSVSPANSESDVDVNTTIVANFSAEMNSDSVISAFTVTNGDTAVTGTVTCSGNQAVFTPASALSSGTTYTATVSNAAMDSNGYPIKATKTWVFTTAASTDDSDSDDDNDTTSSRGASDGSSDGGGGGGGCFITSMF